LPTAKKEANVAELKELLEKATIMIGAEYRGLTVREMTTLRRALRDAGVEARVVKNKLFRIAATQAGVEPAGEVADGPSLIIFGFEDIVAPSKAVADYQKAARNTFAPKKVFFDGAVQDGKVVAELASLPSREELIGKLAGAFIQPVQQLATLLNDSIQSFARLVDARTSQLEGEGGESSSEPQAEPA
jgi:large subunit ribosomal protein L10